MKSWAVSRISWEIYGRMKPSVHEPRQTPCRHGQQRRYRLGLARSDDNADYQDCGKLGRQQTRRGSAHVVLE